MILQNLKILYHITPTKNIELIKEKGFIPCCLNKEFFYPDRVYFFTDNFNITELRNIAKGLRNSSDNKDENYSLIVINLLTIPKNVSFHYDPHFENAIYTYDKIPSNSIANILDLKI